MMTKEITYEEFLKIYVTETYMDFCITFKYKNVIYQFDFNDVSKPTDIPGKTPYDLVTWEENWKKVVSRKSFKNLKEAVENSRFDGLHFKDIFESNNFEIIDIS